MVYFTPILEGIIGGALIYAAYMLGRWVGYKEASGGAPSLTGTSRRQQGAGRDIPIHEEPPPAAREETDEQRRAFEMMMNYDAADAYGMRKEDRT